MKTCHRSAIVVIAVLTTALWLQPAGAQIPPMGRFTERGALESAPEASLNLPQAAVNYSSGDTALDAFFLKEMTRLAIPGFAACIFDREGIIWEGYYGHANVALDVPVTDSTMFNIASISKIVTAAPLLRLYDQGRFGLDDDINGHLPFPVRNPNHPDSAITFRMLMTHTSSIADNWPKLPYRSGDPLVSLGTFLQDYLVPGGLLYDGTKNFATTKPGDGYLYNNVGIALCAYLVERMSGVPFEQYCRDTLFAPIGMANTAWMFRDLDTTLVARPYYGGADAGLFSHDFFPASELKTTVRALARFFRMHMRHGEIDGVRILDSSSVRAALTVQIPQPTAIFTGYYCHDTSRVGLCWERIWFDGRDIWGHNGGWPAGVSTCAFFVESAGVGAIWFANTSLPTSFTSGFDYELLEDRLLAAAGAAGVCTLIDSGLSDSLYAVSTDLLTLDPNTVHPTPISELYVGPIHGLSIHPDTREIYGTNTVAGGTEIRRISASDGISLHATNTLAPGLYGIAFESAQFLYAVAPLSPSGGQFYRINVKTGDAFLVRTYPSARFYGLAMDPSGSGLWASGRTTRGYDCIYTLDLASGDTTFVGNTGDGLITHSLAFLNGRLLGTKTLGMSTSIISIDVHSGQGTLVGSTGVGGITGIAAYPGVVNVVRTETPVPEEFALSQNYPNPFNPSTTITFALPKSVEVRLSVYDMLGREVSVLVDEQRNAGIHHVKFEASRLSSGVYFYRLRAGDFTNTMRLILLK